ncbi:MAG: hypothetical protein IJ637_08765, partial [Prevotella sp.]|nr:hypothetical protein [Prevotella sp.]
TVTLTPVDDVQAGTAVVLKGDADTYSIPVIAASSTEKGDLKGATADLAFNAEATNDYYMLAMVDGKARFSKLTGGTIKAGKAYLEVAKGAGAPALNVVFADGDVTAIKAVDAAKQNGAVFNLAGQRVAQPTKGLYIVNGKKVIVK